MTHDTGSLKKVAVLTGLMMLIGGAEISSAATIVQSKNFGPLSGPSDTITLTYDLFNPSDGTLSNIGVTFASQIAEPVVVTWTIVFELTPNDIGLSNSGTGDNPSYDVNFGLFSGAILGPAFTGVGDFPAIFTYTARCDFTGGPTCGAGWSGNLDITYNFTPAEAPLPAALPLFATSLGALGLLTWRRRRKAIAA